MCLVTYAAFWLTWWKIGSILVSSFSSFSFNRATPILLKQVLSCMDFPRSAWSSSRCPLCFLLTSTSLLNYHCRYYGMLWTSWMSPYHFESCSEMFDLYCLDNCWTRQLTCSSSSAAHGRLKLKGCHLDVALSTLGLWWTRPSCETEPMSPRLHSSRHNC